MYNLTITTPLNDGVHIIHTPANFVVMTNEALVPCEGPFTVLVLAQLPTESVQVSSYNCYKGQQDVLGILTIRLACC